jgi:hypothetical protein
LRNNIEEQSGDKSQRVFHSDLGPLSGQSYSQNYSKIGETRPIKPPA